MAPAKIIDADAHMSEPYDLWSKRIDRRFRDEAPRVVENHNGRKGLYWVFEDVVQRINSDRPGAATDMERPGGWDPAERVKDMAIDGIDATVLYSTRALTLYSSQNPELQEACFKVYNDWLAEFCGYAHERFAGLALIALWDVERGTKELERTRKLGLRGAQIWSSPPDHLPRYDEPAYDRFWAAAQDLNVPISLHLNTGGNKKGAYRSSDSYSYTYTRMIMAASQAGLCRRRYRVDSGAARARGQVLCEPDAPGPSVRARNDAESVLQAEYLGDLYQGPGGTQGGADLVVAA